MTAHGTYDCRRLIKAAEETDLASQPNASQSQSVLAMIFFLDIYSVDKIISGI